MELKIFIDRLKGGHIDKFSQEISSDFLGVQEDDLSFIAPIKLKGESYLASDHLIVKLHIQTKISMPCSICNKQTEISIVVPDFYHAEPIEEIRSAVFDYSEYVREEILLQIPQFTECSGGTCPERETIKKYLKEKKSSNAVANPSTTHFPFSDL